MARPLRIEYPGAVYHLTSRGNERKAIFRADADREAFLAFLGKVVHRFLVEEETYLAEVLRFVVLNPVRARMVERPENYRWSSYRATAGLETAPEWLALDDLVPWFGDDQWQMTYQEWVAAAIDSEECLWDKLVHGIYLGTEPWLKTVRPHVESKLRSDDHPITQRAVGRPAMATIIDAVARAFSISADEIRHRHGGSARMVTAWLGRWEGSDRLRSIAASLRLNSSGRAGDLIRECEARLRGNPTLQGYVDQAYANLAA